jgi:capsule polysaccharide export protein KpsC/LpsZ
LKLKLRTQRQQFAITIWLKYFDSLLFNYSSFNWTAKTSGYILSKFRMWKEVVAACFEARKYCFNFIRNWTAEHKYEQDQRTRFVDSESIQETPKWRL